ncbi:MAG: 4Fe-4S binding protein [Lachnospiraceae bacterium]|nr:4Fe-4S binding protein [Lachnospiraceae bacterium]
MKNKQTQKQQRKKGWFRPFLQLITLGLYNLNFKGFRSGKIYNGTLKGICTPGLHCYSCPASAGSCPLGTLQNTLSNLRGKINLYGTGLLLLFGAALGRVVCGFLCPFGFLQDLLYKIPTKKFTPAFKRLRFMKYAVLVGLVVVFPIVTMLTKYAGEPGFCKFLCPMGTIAGIELTAANSEMRSLIGVLFWLKLGFLLTIILCSIFIYRPFCRLLCPLGAFYGLFNKIALLRYHVDETACTHCGACEKACPVRIDPVAECNSAECVRCGKCKNICPASAISYRSKPKKCTSGKDE